MSSCLTILPNTCSDRIYNEKPGGLYNCINLTYTTLTAFDPDSVVIRLLGNTLDPTQYSLGVDNQSFTLIVDTTDITALQCPPEAEDCLRIDYDLDTTSDVCLTLL